MPPFWEIVSLTFMAGFKYMVAVFMAIGYGWSLWYSISFSVLGGLLGVAVYMAFGSVLQQFIRRFFPGWVSEEKMAKRQQLVQRVRNVGGLAGIAFLTPILLTVPIGTLSAVGLGYRWPKVLVYMFVAFSFWSFLFFGLYDFTGFDLREWLSNWF